MRPALFSLALLTLGGCSQFMELESFPTGYAYHQEPYKSQPGPPAKDIGYPYTPERNAVVLEKWQAAAAVLAERLETQINFAPQEIYLEMLPNDNAFNYTLDHVLREELENRGYKITTRPDFPLHIRPEAYLPEDENAQFQIGSFNEEPELIKEVNEPERARKFMISLAIVRGDDYAGRVRDTFLLPAYGYVRGEGTQKRGKRYYRAVDGVMRMTSAPDEAPFAEDAGAGAPRSLLPAPVESEAIGEPVR